MATILYLSGKIVSCAYTVAPGILGGHVPRPPGDGLKLCLVLNPIHTAFSKTYITFPLKGSTFRLPFGVSEWSASLLLSFGAIREENQADLSSITAISDSCSDNGRGYSTT